jgi:N-acetylglucosamine-6-sulfatase
MTPHAAAAGAPPNVVVIMTDDQRIDSMRWMDVVGGCLGSRGTTFTRAMVPTSLCCPARASFLTGLFAHGTEVWSNLHTPGVERATGGWPAFHDAGMEQRTIATWLDPTYRTMLIGKYLNSYDHAPRGFVPPGWNVWHAFAGANGAYYHYRLVHSDGHLTSYGSHPADYSTDVLRRLAVVAIHATPRREPVFLYFAPFAPHGPSIPAPRHQHACGDLAPFGPPSLNESDVRDKPPWLRSLGIQDPRAVELLRRRQCASLQAVDEAVEAIVDALRGTGRLHDTLLIFTSDNGSSWGEHRIPRGSKYLPYAAQTVSRSSSVGTDTCGREVSPLDWR